MSDGKNEGGETKKPPEKKPEIAKPWPILRYIN